MEVNKINNLLELFYKQYKKQNKKDIFLQSLKEPKKNYSWEDVYKNIIKLSEEISKKYSLDLAYYIEKQKVLKDY